MLRKTAKESRNRRSTALAISGYKFPVNHGATEMAKTTGGTIDESKPAWFPLR
jgi:hypothetical protein